MGERAQVTVYLRTGEWGQTTMYLCMGQMGQTRGDVLCMQFTSCVWLSEVRPQFTSCVVGEWGQTTVYVLYMVEWGSHHSLRLVYV